MALQHTKQQIATCTYTRYLVRDFSDGAADMSFVSEAMADFNTGRVQNANDHFEHLTCFVGGMLILGERLGAGFTPRLSCRSHFVLNTIPYKQSTLQVCSFE